MNMRTVYRYPVPLSNIFTLKMPKGAEILTAGSQHGGDAFLFALVDPDASAEEVSFRLANTGEPISEDELKYVNTFQLRDGGLVYHLFEIVTPSPVAGVV